MALKADELPAILIHLTKDSMPRLLEDQMHAIMRVLKPERYEAQIIAGPVDDGFGTPLSWTDALNVFDSAGMKGDLYMMSKVSPMSMLCMRMQWGPYSRVEPSELSTLPFEHVGVHLGENKAIIFVVTKGEPVTITDDKALFPSDALVTQLRMLEERSK